MEQTRTSSLVPQAVPVARTAQGIAGKSGTAQDGAQGAGFALLLAAMGPGAGEASGLSQVAAGPMSAVAQALPTADGQPMGAAPHLPAGAAMNPVIDAGAGAQGGVPAGMQAAAKAGEGPTPRAARQALTGNGMGLPEAVLPMEAGDAAAEPLPPAASPPDAAALAAWMAGLQPTVAMAQGVGAAMESGSDALAGRVGLGLVRQGLDSLVGQTARLDGAAEAAVLNGLPQEAGAAAPMDRGGMVRAQPWQAADTVQGAVAPGRGQVHAALRAAAAQAGVEPVVAQAAAHALGASQAAGAPAIGGQDVLQAMAQPMARAEVERVAPALSGDAAAGAMGPATGAGDAVPQAGEAALAAGGGLQGLGPAARQGPNGAMDTAAQASQGGAGDLLADQMSEQVSYWVHHKTQNAELTLDQGGQPVEVKVALTGEQAHVTLRSDQAEARQWLDAGRDQLHDMLQRQGLQLAGMTVGTSGGGGAAARQDERAPGRQGTQRASVQAAAPVGGVPHRGQGVGERGVDIFV